MVIPPAKAANNEAKLAAAIIGLAGVLYPLSFKMAIPGRNCPVKLTKISGSAKFKVENHDHSGAINCGRAM